MDEDQQTLDFIMSQCTMAMDSENIPSTDYLGSQSWQSVGVATDAQNFSWDMSIDQARLFAPQLGLTDPVVDTLIADQMVDPTEELPKFDVDTARIDQADSVSEGSDGGEEDEDEGRLIRGKGGKRHHSKNLVAERKRRKKLNDRLYMLRSLVPKITKVSATDTDLCSFEFVVSFCMPCLVFFQFLHCFALQMFELQRSYVLVTMFFFKLHGHKISCIYVISCVHICI